MGKEVGGAFLVGPPLEPYSKRRRSPFARQVRDLLDHLSETISAGPGARLLPEYEERLQEILGLDNHRLAAIRAGDRQQLRAVRVRAANRLAAHQYRQTMERVKPYGGRVVLFMPGEGQDEMKSQVLEQWRSALSREPEIVPVPGTHANPIYGEGARLVGSQLRAEILRWQQPGESDR
jgi:hypothetical protein